MLRGSLDRRRGISAIVVLLLLRRRGIPAIVVLLLLRRRRRISIAASSDDVV
jgi:hypothetical protein